MTIPAGITVTTRPGGAKAYLLGSVFGAMPVPDVGPYVTADGVAVPHHGWFQVALDRTHASPLTIVQTPAQLVAAHRAFPMGNTGIPFEGSTLPGSVLFANPSLAVDSPPGRPITTALIKAPLNLRNQPQPP